MSLILSRLSTHSLLDVKKHAVCHILMPPHEWMRGQWPVIMIADVFLSGSRAEKMKPHTVVLRLRHSLGFALAKVARVVL